MEERRKRASVAISGVLMLFAIAFGGALMAGHVQGQTANQAHEPRVEQTTVKTYTVQATQKEECNKRVMMSVPTHKQKEFIEDHQKLANQIRQEQDIEDMAILYHELRDRLGLSQDASICQQ